MRTAKLVFFLAGLWLFAAASATPVLRPSQQAALDAILATTDPAMRAMMSEQLIPALSNMTDAQIQMMLAEFAKSDDDSAASDADFVEADTATPEDLEYNRQQYEPAIRNAWAASNAFDTFVGAELASNCGPDGNYAIFGSGWRYEVMPLSPTWPRPSTSADLDVQIIGASYAPQDGRYRFDFSDMPTEFDSESVRRAIAQACRVYHETGTRFLAAAGPVRTGEPPADGQRLENTANAEVQAARLELETELQHWSNSWIVALYSALINAEPVS
jgi:hypothetical protein